MLWCILLSIFIYPSYSQISIQEILFLRWWSKYVININTWNLFVWYITYTLKWLQNDVFMQVQVQVTYKYCKTEYKYQYQWPKHIFTEDSQPQQSSVLMNINIFCTWYASNWFGTFQNGGFGFIDEMFIFLCNFRNSDVSEKPLRLIKPVHKHSLLPERRSPFLCNIRVSKLMMVWFESWMEGEEIMELELLLTFSPIALLLPRSSSYLQDYNSEMAAQYVCRYVVNQ